jgi:hypothetical protein
VLGSVVVVGSGAVVGLGVAVGSGAVVGLGVAVCPPFSTSATFVGDHAGPDGAVGSGAVVGLGVAVCPPLTSATPAGPDPHDEIAATAATTRHVRANQRANEACMA